MNKSKYEDRDKQYALAVVAKLDGNYTAAASYLKDKGKVVVTGKTLRNWGNDISLTVAEPLQDAVILADDRLDEVNPTEILSQATKGLGAVVARLSERLADDKYTKKMNSYELVNIGNFFASLSEMNKDKQQGGGSTTNIYQQIINQTYHAKGD